MASPSPVTMPAFEVTESQVYVVKKSTTVMGQMASFAMQSNVPSRKVARIGDTNKSTSYSPAEHSANMELYSEFDPDELATILGDPKGGNWAGTEELRLNSTITAYDLTVEVYDAATGVSDTLLATWTIDNFKPTSLAVQIRADSPVTYTINGECDDIFLTPESDA